MRIASWNLWHDETLVLERLDVVGGELQALNPDVVCLQEVRQSGGSSTAQMLAARLGMEYVEHFCTSFSGQEEKLVGIAVLSKHKIARDFALSLPGVDGFLEERGAVGVEIFANKRPFFVFSTHLAWGGSREALRLEQVRVLDEAIKSYAGPEVDHYGHAGEHHPVCVLAGDFNTTRDRAALRWLCGDDVVENSSTYWTDALAVAGVENDTVDTANNSWARKVADDNLSRSVPGRRIDFVFVRGWGYGRPGEVAAGGMLGVEARDGLFGSDHYGVFVDLSE